MPSLCIVIDATAAPKILQWRQGDGYRTGVRRSHVEAVIFGINVACRIGRTPHRFGPIPPVRPPFVQPGRVPRSLPVSHSATPFTGVFSSHVITRELLSRGSSRLIEARRMIASPAFAIPVGRPKVGRARVVSAPMPGPAKPRPAAKRVSPAARTPIMLRAKRSAAAAIEEGWTFTYANGTFSAGHLWLDAGCLHSNRPTRVTARGR